MEWLFVPMSSTIRASRAWVPGEVLDSLWQEILMRPLGAVLSPPELVSTLGWVRRLRVIGGK